MMAAFFPAMRLTTHCRPPGHFTQPALGLTIPILTSVFIKSMGLLPLDSVCPFVLSFAKIFSLGPFSGIPPPPFLQVLLRPNVSILSFDHMIPGHSICQPTSSSIIRAPQQKCKNQCTWVRSTGRSMGFEGHLIPRLLFLAHHQDPQPRTCLQDLWDVTRSQCWRGQLWPESENTWEEGTVRGLGAERKRAVGWHHVARKQGQGTGGKTYLHPVYLWWMEGPSNFVT